MQFSCTHSSAFLIWAPLFVHQISPLLSFWFNAHHLYGLKEFNSKCRTFRNCIFIRIRENPFSNSVKSFSVCKKMCLNWRKPTICHLNLGDDTVHTYLHSAALPLLNEFWISAGKYFRDRNSQLCMQWLVHALSPLPDLFARERGFARIFLPRGGIWACLGGNRIHRQPCGKAA